MTKDFYRQKMAFLSNALCHLEMALTDINGAMGHEDRSGDPSSTQVELGPLYDAISTASMAVSMYAAAVRPLAEQERSGPAGGYHLFDSLQVPSRLWDGQTETVDWKVEDQRKTWLAMVIIKLISANPDYFKVAEPGSVLRVGCLINGVPVQLSKLVDEMADDYDRRINREANRIVKERTGKIAEFLSRLEDAVKREFPDLSLDEED